MRDRGSKSVGAGGALDEPGEGEGLVHRFNREDMLGIGGLLWAVCVLTGYIHVHAGLARYGAALGGLLIFIPWVVRRRAERAAYFEEHKARLARERH